MRYSSKLSIDFNYLASNYHKLRELAPSNDVVFMVKANAYGHGVDEVTRFSNQELGVKEFGVASVGEAMGVRKRQSDLMVELYVFSDTELFNPAYEECYTDFRNIPVIYNLEQLEFFLSNLQFKYVPLVLKLDTGMHRLGISDTPEDIEKIIELLRRFGRKEIDHLMTHFSCSNLPLKENDRTHRQYASFVKIKKELRASGIHIHKTSCANSGAIEQKFALDESHIRPGLMLYGPASVGSFRGEIKSPWQGKSISRLCSKILTMRAVKKGTPIGYGAHVCHKDGILVNLPIGYGDGILTYYSGVKLCHRGHQFQILGRVNMDLITLLFDSDAKGDLQVGDEICLWDYDQHSVSDLATQAKTIPYQIYTAITDRVLRQYH